MMTRVRAAALQAFPARSISTVLATLLSAMVRRVLPKAGTPSKNWMVHVGGATAAAYVTIYVVLLSMLSTDR